MLYIIGVICLVGQVSAFSATKSGGIVTSPRQRSLHLHLQKSRRSFLVEQAIATSTIATTSFIIPANALLMDKSSPDITPFKGGSEEAKVKVNHKYAYDIILHTHSDYARTIFRIVYVVP